MIECVSTMRIFTKVILSFYHFFILSFLLMITYNSFGSVMPELDERSTTAWLRRVAESHGRRVGDINYVFCNDEEILGLNRQYIGHDYYTDHIGFDYSAGDILSGDIYVGIETVETNAELFGKTYDDELHRVIVHGLLHLVGIKDKTDAERAVMEVAEDEALAMR